MLSCYLLKLPILNQSMMVKYILLLLTFLLTISLPVALAQPLLPDDPYQPAALTAGDVIDRIKANITVDWTGETVDTFKAGSAGQEVTGIATTFLATLDVLKRAHAQGANMVITHEPTFYNHLDDKSYFTDDPVMQAKLDFIRENNMVVFRFHDFWHRTRPDGIFEGVVDAFGWGKYRQGEQQLFNIPATTLDQLARDLSQKFNTSTLRVVGPAEMQISTVGILPGAAGMRSQVAMLRENELDVLIVGESAEWEAVEYTRDGLEAGIQKALIVMGHADSEEAGMEFCAEWLNQFIDEVPVVFVPAGNPLWSPE